MSMQHQLIFSRKEYNHKPHNDVSVNDGPHIRRWSHKVIILSYNITILTIALQMPTVFSTVNKLYKFVAL